MTETVLWTGGIMLAGAVGALAARAMRLPAACGAMLGGFTLGTIAPAADLMTLRVALVAFLSLLAGVEIDLTRLVRDRRSIAAAAGVQCLLVGGLVALAGLMLGCPAGICLLLAVGLMASSPTVVMAVASEFRVSGDLTRRLLAQSSLGLVASLTLACLVWPAPAGMFWWPLDLLLGAFMGFAILVPLSRMSQRGAMVAGAAIGALALTLVTRGPAPRLEHVAAMSVLAGFVVGNFSPNREAIRDALRDLGLPCAIVLFSVAVFGLEAATLAAGLGVGLALLAARAAGLMLAGLLAPGGRVGIMQSLAQLPVAGVASGGPLTALATLTIAESQTTPATLWQGVLVACVASELLGSIAARWVLARGGEAPPAEQEVAG